jgi:hypothetical protein
VGIGVPAPATMVTDVGGECQEIQYLAISTQHLALGGEWWLFESLGAKCQMPRAEAQEKQMNLMLFLW